MPKTAFSMNMQLTGQERVRKMLQTAEDAVGAILGNKKIPKMLLKMQQDRFAKAGTNPRAQKSPEGVRWAGLSENTKRRKNKDRGQVLTDTDKLRKAIVVARDSLKSALRVGTGSADIAVRRVQNRQVNKDGSYSVRYTDVYGLAMQEGFNNARTGTRVQARPFLGVGSRDAEEVEDYMQELMNRHFAAFSF